ncbi:MAG TPA: SRPBCC family protein [Acidimicrobiales bacterium]|nr:SRPBCC family protein [Acidimicrobiales bacterium]
MDLDADATLGLAAGRVFEAVADLATYPAWAGIVGSAAPAVASPDGADPGPAWDVDLVARLGPLSRSKRVRMVRDVCDEGKRARFVRRELDGARHSAWILEATLTPAGTDRTTLHMHLHYSGARWLPGLDLLLREEARRAGGRLERFVRDGAP